jgi:microsomal dipeptidase-like Zn-dependent dipeptidase
MEGYRQKQKLPDILRKRGFTSKDIENVMYLNFVRYLKGYFN